MNVNRLCGKFCAAFIGLAVFAMLAACDPGPPPTATGFAGLGSNASGFAPVLPGKRLVFPLDHGSHPGYRIEWWYVTADLQDRQGRSWGVQWTLFRSAIQPAGPGVGSGWSEPTVWLGHAGLTGLDGHRFGEKIARGGIGQAGVESQPLHAWIDDWQLLSQTANNDELSAVTLNASGTGFKYRLQLTSDKPLVLQGDQGYSQKSGQGQASYYYSQPFFQAQGVLTVDGQDYAVQGPAWLDREWSSQPLAAEQKGWDWFSLHLADGAKVMVFQLRHNDGSRYRAGTWIGADGKAETLRSDDIDLTPGPVKTIQGHALSTHWSIRIPSHGLQVEAQALRDDAWMGTRFPYWEGPIGITGSQAGVGYLEMTGY